MLHNKNTVKTCEKRGYKQHAVYQDKKLLHKPYKMAVQTDYCLLPASASQQKTLSFNVDALAMLHLGGPPAVYNDMRCAYDMPARMQNPAN